MKNSLESLEKTKAVQYESPMEVVFIRPAGQDEDSRTEAQETR